MTKPVKIAILADGKLARHEFETTARSGKHMGETLARAGRTAALGLAGGLGLAAVAAVKLAKGAADDQAGATRLAQTLKTAAGATKGQVAATESYITAQGKLYGISDDQLRPALGRLAQATGSVTKARKLTTLAENVAAGSGKSLEAVTKVLGKAQTGSLGGLRAYGIQTKDAAGHSKTLSQVTGELAAKFKGAAAKQAGTLQGQLDKLKVTLSEAGESIGYKLIPPLTKFAEFLLTKGIPATFKFAAYLKTTLGPAFSAIGGFVRDAVGRFREFLDGLRNGSSAASPFLTSVQNLAATIQTQVLPVIAQFGVYVATRVAPALVDVGRIVGTKVVPILTSLYRFTASSLVPTIVALATKVGQNLRPVFDQLVATFRGKVLPTLSKGLDKFHQYQPTIQRVIGIVAKVIAKFIEIQTAITGKVLPVLIRFAGYLGGAYYGAVRTSVDVTAKIILKLIDFGRKLVNAAQKVAAFARAAKTKFSDVITFVKNLPTRIVQSIGDLSKVLYEKGKNLIGGLVKGIKDAAASIPSAVGGAVSGAISHIPGFGIQSAGPSPFVKRLIRGVTAGADGIAKVFDRVGDLVDKTLDARLKATVAHLHKTLKGKALDKATAAAEKANAAAHRATTQALRAQEKALAVNGRAQDRNNARLDKARDKLKGLVQASHDYAKSIKDAVVAFGDVTTLGNQDDPAATTATGIVDQLKSRVADAKQYSSLLRKLAADKLNKTSLQQLLDAGVEGGLTTAEALAAGGKGTIAQINKLTAELTKTGGALGNKFADKFYSAGIKTAQAIVDSLQKRQKQLDRIAEHMGEVLAATVAKALKLPQGGNGFARGTGGLPAPAQVAFATHTTRSTPEPVRVKITLDAHQLSQISRGRQIALDLDYYIDKGGRTRYIGRR